jgi:hypothetical protein
MILDRQTLFSDRQLVTATAGSVDQIDLSPRGSGVIRDIGAGVALPLYVQVVESFNNLTSLTISVQLDEDIAFGSPTTVAVSPAIPLAQLVPGFSFPQLVDNVPRGANERYMRLLYTVAGTAPTTGRITAGISLTGPQTNG